MQIKGKLSGQVENHNAGLHEESDGQTVKVKLAVRVDRDRCAETFGDEFADLVAFSGLVEREGEDGEVTYAHLNAPKPTNALVMEMHQIKIFGKKIDGVQPALGVRPVKGEAKVDVLITIPVAVGEDDAFDLAVLRSTKRGQATKVEFNPKQEELGLKVRKLAVAEELHPGA